MVVLDWLLDSDPAIRWQVLQDLVETSAGIVKAERARVATEGWGARLLALQGEDGLWAGGACFPARRLRPVPPEPGQPWTATLPTLQLLRDLGIDPDDGRVERVIQLRHPIVSAIDGQAVLDEVVRADAHEVRLACEQVDR